MPSQTTRVQAVSSLRRAANRFVPELPAGRAPRHHPSALCSLLTDAWEGDKKKVCAGFRCNGRGMPSQGLGYALCGNAHHGREMFSPLLRELSDMRFQWDRRREPPPWSDATPFETGVPETALAFRAALRRGAETCLPIRAAIGADRAASDQVASVHVPDRGLAVRVLKKNVGAVATGSDGVPTRPGIGADWPAANEFVPVHLPDRDLAAAGVLKKDLGKAVAVEIARSDRFPSRPGIGVHGPAADQFVPERFPPSSPRRYRSTPQCPRPCLCRPQPKVAAGVDPLEQNLAVKEGQVAGREARRIRSADRGQFKGPAPRAVRLPRTTGIERVLASKKNDAAEHGRTFILRRSLQIACLANGRYCSRDPPHNLSVLGNDRLSAGRLPFLHGFYVYRLTGACRGATK